MIIDCAIVSSINVLEVCLTLSGHVLGITGTFKSSICFSTSLPLMISFVSILQKELIEYKLVIS